MKKFFALLLCFVMLLLLCACGVTPNDNGTTVTDVQGTTSTTLEDILDYIDETTTVTENPDGTTTYTFEGITTTPDIPTLEKTTTAKKKTTTTTKKRTTSTTREGYSTVVVTEKTNPTTTAKPAPIPTAPPTTTTTTVVQDPATPTTTKKLFSYDYTTNQEHTAIPLSERYYYSLLNDEWKGYYRQIDDAVRNLDASVTFNTDISEERKNRIYFLYQLDTPELFYLAATMTTTCSGDGTSGLVFSYSVGNKPGEFCRYGVELTDALRQKIIAKKDKFDNAVNAIIETVPAAAPAVVKERMIYDKILLSSEYNMPAAMGNAAAIGGAWDGLAADNWTAYGIMINHTGVCESYAESFQVLCNAVGIPCTRISNDTHAWSAVKLGGKWYQCDVTFDDPVGGAPNNAYHMYFNLTDAQMADRGFRTWLKGPYVDEGYFVNMHYPVCTATDESWENFLLKYGE